MNEDSDLRSLPHLESDRLMLRLATETDVPAILAYYRDNRDFLTPWQPQPPADFFTPGCWYAEVENRRRAFQEDRAVKLFLFERTYSPKPAIIGTLNFSNIVRGVFQACNVGYSLAEHRQRQGYMTEAFQLAIPYLFEVVKLHRIQANYMPHNQPSGQLLKRLGFVVEGYARNYLQINGRWEDHILTSLVNPDWR